MKKIKYNSKKLFWRIFVTSPFCPCNKINFIFSVSVGSIACQKCKWNNKTTEDEVECNNILLKNEFNNH